MQLIDYVRTEDEEPEIGGLSFPDFGAEYVWSTVRVGVDEPILTKAKAINLPKGMSVEGNEITITNKLKFSLENTFRRGGIASSRGRAYWEHMPPACASIRPHISTAPTKSIR